jgi:hypothetical protein
VVDRAAWNNKMLRSTCTNWAAAHNRQKAAKKVCLGENHFVDGLLARAKTNASNGGA